MAFVKIRGAQIQGSAIKDSHIAADAAIAENKLSIDFNAHTETLANKKVLYKVQLNDIQVAAGVSALEFVNVEGRYKFNDGVQDFFIDGLPVTSNGTSQGVITDAPNNKFIMRDGVTEDTPLRDVDGNIIFGRITYVVETDKYVLTFDNDGVVETPYTMVVPVTVDLFYLKRGSLLDMPEDFAVTEGGSFVEGAMDVTATFNLEQLAKDIYGGAWALDNDGVGNLTTSLATQIADEIIARGVAVDAVQDALDTEVSTRSLANTALQEALTAEAGTRATADTALSDRIADLETGGGAEVTDTHTRDAATVNGVFAIDTFVDLEERLDDIESTVDAKVKLLLDADTSGATALSDAVAQEVIDRNAAVTVEHDRAVAAEGVLTTAVSDEVTRATAAEGVLTDALDAEVIRAGLAEVANADAIAAEVTRAGLAEVANADAIAAEVTRAGLAEVALAGRATALETEITAARGSAVDLDTRLDRALNEDGTLKQGTKIHAHTKQVFSAVGGEQIVNLTGGKTFQVGDDSLDVFVNGVLQAKGLHYAELADGTGVDFSPEVLAVGDVVIFKFINNNAE